MVFLFRDSEVGEQRRAARAVVLHTPQVAKCSGGAVASDTVFSRALAAPGVRYVSHGTVKTVASGYVLPRLVSCSTVRSGQLPEKYSLTEMFSVIRPSLLTMTAVRYFHAALQTDRTASLRPAFEQWHRCSRRVGCSPQPRAFLAPNKASPFFQDAWHFSNFAFH